MCQNSSYGRTFFSTYPEFWPYYLRKHYSPSTREITILGPRPLYYCLGSALLSAYELPLIAPTARYGPAWVAYGLIKCNRLAKPVQDLSDGAKTAIW